NAVHDEAEAVGADPGRQLHDRDNRVQSKSEGKRGTAVCHGASLPRQLAHSKRRAAPSAPTASTCAPVRPSAPPCAAGTPHRTPPRRYRRNPHASQGPKLGTTRPTIPTAAKFFRCLSSRS